MNPNLLTKKTKKTFTSERKQSKEYFNFWITSTYITLLSVIVSLLLYYVWMLNVNATQWYDIKILEQEKKNLLIEKELLDAKIAELESLWTILENKNLEGMEKATNPNYLVIKENVQYVYND